MQRRLAVNEHTTRNYLRFQFCVFCSTCRAENYRPRNPYRDRFFNADGIPTTIPGAIPKGKRLSPLPKQLQENYRHHDHGLPWEEAQRARDEDDDQTVKRRRGRSLADASTDEPAVEHPLSCVSEGDSVLFDLSSGCYPVYEKDSLLNSNLEYV